MRRFNKVVWSSKKLKKKNQKKQRVAGKTLTLPKHEDIVLNSITKTRKRWDSPF